MKPSEHDLVAARIREEERQKLITQYEIEAINHSNEMYGFLNVRGHEVPDPTVVEPPLGYIEQPDIFEQMRRMIRREISAVAELQEMETFEEADDFETDEDPVDFVSPWEEYFDPAPGEPPGPVPSNPKGDPNAQGSPGVTGGEPPVEQPPPAPAEPAPR